MECNVMAPRRPVAAGKCEGFPRASFAVAEVRDGAVAGEVLDVICEHELALAVNGDPLATLMCSDANLAELACGFLFSEGVIEGADEILSLAVGPGRESLSLRLNHPVRRPAAPVRTSGFGGVALASPRLSVAGSRAAAARGAAVPADGAAPSDSVPFPRPRAGASPFPEEAPALTAVEAAAIQEAVTAMRVGAREYAATRGTHCSALFADGACVALFEDIGRHNTFDKLAGWCLLAGVDPAGMLLATTGRVSSEMLRKAARLGVATVASLSGPTDAAVREARARGIRLAGYANSSRLTLYAG